MNKTVVLVVEDDRPIRNLIVTTLKMHDYKYLTANNGVSAIMEASSHHPDIVLLDLGLPDMEGVDVIKKIRTWSNMPIIVISARSEDSDKIEALDSVILVATQVVEAGVDIDMDIGYKDISRLDSEEQFMGRINRSGRKSGIVYFFDLDNAEKIYSGDKRIEKDKTLVNKEMRELLTAKNFPAYYENGILPLVLAEKKKCNDENIEDFFQKTVGNLDMPKVDKRMQLINDNRLMKSVYLGRIIQEENGEELDGRFVWDEYKQLIEETEMEYSERKVKLHNVRSKMNAFIYQFSCKAEFMEDEQIGELYYIENGEAYFDENDILRRELFEEGKDLFI